MTSYRNAEVEVEQRMLEVEPDFDWRLSRAEPIQL